MIRVPKSCKSCKRVEMLYYSGITNTFTKYITRYIFHYSLCFEDTYGIWVERCNSSTRSFVFDSRNLLYSYLSSGWMPQDGQGSKY